MRLIHHGVWPDEQSSCRLWTFLHAVTQGRVGEPLVRQLLRVRRAMRLRRSLRQLKPLLEFGIVNLPAISRVRNTWGNVEWSANIDFLVAVIQACQETRHGIVECGSGLTTAIISLANQKSQRSLVAFEHDASWAHRTKRRLRFAGIGSAQVLHRPLLSKNGWSWYGVFPEDLPMPIDLVICDGPPGDTPGGRWGMLPALRANLADSPVILLDDVDRQSELSVAEAWAAELNLVVTVSDPDDVGRRYALIRAQT